jgi:hypothetical protein
MLAHALLWIGHRDALSISCHKSFLPLFSRTPETIRSTPNPPFSHRCMHVCSLVWMACHYRSRCMQCAASRNRTQQTSGHARQRWLLYRLRPSTRGLRWECCFCLYVLSSRICPAPKRLNDSMSLSSGGVTWPCFLSDRVPA